MIQAYIDVLGDDVNRRQVLLSLVSGAASTEVLGHAFDFALDAPPLSVDEWQARVEDYGHDYVASLGAAELQTRLARDLTTLHAHLDNPMLASVVAKLLTLHGLTIQSITFPITPRWFLLAIRAADRSGDVATRVWVRGRAALALAYDDVERELVMDCAHQALALSDRPSVGRLSAQLALSWFDDANRTFDVVGTDTPINDFSFPRWRLALVTSRLTARSGDERLAAKAQAVVEQTLPPTLPRLFTSLELHRALMMSKSGNRQGGIAYARDVLDRLPEEGHRTSLQVLMREIEA